MQYGRYKETEEQRAAIQEIPTLGFYFFWSGRHPFRRRGAEGGGLSARRGWDAGWRTSGAAIFLHTSWAGLLMGMDLAALLLNVHLGHYG